MSPGRHAFYVGKNAAHQNKYHYKKEGDEHGLLLGIAHRGYKQSKSQYSGNIHYCKQIEGAQTSHNRYGIYDIYNEQAQAEIKKTDNPEWE